MIISKIAIRRSVTFTMLYLIAIGFGLFGLSSLKLDLYPNITFPVIGIITQYEGVGPEDIENVLTRPLEQTVVSVENVKKITSTSKVGTSIIIMEFEWGSDMDQAEINVRKMIDFVRDYLPSQASDPITFAFNPSMQPIQYLTVSSEQLGMAELRRVVDEQITPRLERINGVAAAGIQGGLERQIQVLVNPHELASQGLSLQQLIQVLRMENLQIPGGLIDEQNKEFAVKTYGEFTSVGQIENTVVGYKAGVPIYLKNVARVSDGFKEQREIIRNNGRSALMLFIQKQADANTVQTSRAVNEALPGILEKVGQSVEVSTLIDFADFITRSLNNLRTTALQAFVLAFLVLLFFLRNIRSSLIVAVSIPVSVIVTFFVMDQGGLTLNVISMAGLALAIGMLVDNAIVVLENIFRRKEKGMEVKEAAYEGTKQVSMAIIASTLTTLAVFVPILFVPGIAGIMFNDMSVTIVFSLTTSLLVALTLIPLLASRFLQAGKTEAKNRVSQAIGRFLAGVERNYIRTLDFFLIHKKTLFAIITGLFIITVILAGKIGGEFMGRTDQSFVSMNIERESGASLTATNETFLALEEITRNDVPEATNIYSNFGTGEGIGAMFGSTGSNAGQIMISLPDVKDRDRSQFEIQDKLRENFARIPGAKITFEDNSGFMGAAGDVVVKIFGFDRNAAAALGDQVAEVMGAVDGVVDIQKSYSSPQPEYQIYLNRDRISSMGLSVTMVAQTVEAGIKGTLATQYREGGKEYEVLVRFDDVYRDSRADLENIYVTTPMGEQVPLINLAEIVTGRGANKINREDQDRVITVSCMVSGRDLRSVTNDILEGLNRLTFPPDFRWEIGGTAEDMQESFMYLGLALLAAILLVYMVMASQFESLLNPFIILFTIPLAFIGVIFGLFVSGTTLSITAMIGGMLLIGIVVNNGIVLVDYINQLRFINGYKLWEAVVRGGRRRMRPILMTALTTIFSMTPMALELGSGAEIWAPMARAVIGGLTASTFFTLVLIPVLYFTIERWKLNRAIRKGRIEAQETGRPEGANALELN
ncbi:MAG: efflux RND transporter permease subunit [Candidatus Neomarinimicrobiota bacterium]